MEWRYRRGGLGWMPGSLEALRYASVRRECRSPPGSTHYGIFFATRIRFFGMHEADLSTSPPGPLH